MIMRRIPSLRGSGHRRTSVLFATTVLWVLCASVLATTPARAVNEFYERLLREGKALYETGEFRSAARKLELACFGMLEDPPALTRCQIYLSLAHGALGDEAGFKQAFDRLMVLEDRFSTFSQAQVEGDWSRELSEYAQTWVSYETLRRLPGFERAARQQKEAALMDLAVPERKEQLERLLEQEPEALSWRILMAEVDLATGQYQNAVEGTQQVLQEDSERIKAICVRGQALAALGNCEEALEHLYTCSQEIPAEAITESKARCHLRLGQLDEAESTAQSLSDDSTRRALLRDVRRARRTAARQPREATPEDAEASPDDPAAEANAEAGGSGEGPS